MATCGVSWYRCVAALADDSRPGILSTHCRLGVPHQILRILRFGLLTLAFGILRILRSGDEG